jgi:hypothetical protein
MTAKFDCEGCGWHIVDVGRDTVPEHGMCATCCFLCENVPDPEEMMEIREAMGLIVARE